MKKTLSRNNSGLFLESCPNININSLVSDILSKLKVELLKAKISAGGHQVGLVTSPMVNGGVRYWFKCPSCSKRVGKLYSASGVLECRKCSGLDYRSRRYRGMVEHRNVF
jgi:hypothetical protein